MQVRPARVEELEAVGALTVAAYEPFLLGRTDTYADQLRNAHARHLEADLQVAVEDDHLLGTVTVCREGSPWREIAVAGEGEFRMLAVDPAAQGRGVGLVLVQHVLDRFREEGAAAIVLSSLAQMSSAHRLYERLGFVRVPERDWSPKPAVDLIAYRLELQ